MNNEVIIENELCLFVQGLETYHTYNELKVKSMIFDYILYVLDFFGGRARLS